MLSSNLESTPQSGENLSNAARAWWGVWGSLLAVLVKFHGQDLHWVHVHLDTRAYDRLINLAIVYVIMLIALLPVGAIVAAASREHSRIKILTMAVAAPALVTTWAGGDKSTKTLTLPQITNVFVTSAHAADRDINGGTEPSGISLRDGFGQFFGFNKDENRYYVVAGPYKNGNEASAIGSKIMRGRPGLPVFTGEVDTKTGSTVLVVGNSMSYSDAKSFRDKVKEIPELKEAKDIWLTSKPPGLKTEEPVLR